MQNLNPSQLKSLSEFLNMIAVAWFSVGVISPLFIKPESLVNIFILIGVSIIMTIIFLGGSLFVLRKVKL